MVFKQFFVVFTKLYLRMKLFVLCLLLLPIGVVAVIVSVSQSQATGLQVGLVVEESAGYARAIVQELQENPDITFHLVDSQDALVQGVTDGTYVLGYVFEKGFSSALEAGDLKGEIGLVKLEDDFYYKYINQVVTGAVATQYSPLLAQQAVGQVGGESDLEALEEAIEVYGQSQSAFSIAITTVGGTQEVGESTLIPNLVRGLVCVFLLLCCLMAMGTMGGEGQAFMPHLSPLRAVAYQTIPAFVMAFVAGVVSLLLTWGLYAGGVALLPQVALLLGYLVSLFLLSLGLHGVVSKDTLVIFTPCLVLGLCLTHPIFFDITVLFPQVEWVLRLLPTYQYLAWDSAMVPYWLGINGVLLLWNWLRWRKG